MKLISLLLLLCLTGCLNLTLRPLVDDVTASDGH